MIRSNKNDVRKVETPVTATPSPAPTDISGEIPVSPPAPTPSNIPSSANTSAADDHVIPAAIIGPKIRVKGELIGEEDLLIQGYVEGTIDLKGNNLTVGKQGVIKANVLAKTISIEGTVEGDVFGQERISILSSSNVKGNLVADRVTLEDGAKFRGSIDMETGAQNAPLKDFGFNSAAKPQYETKAPLEDKTKEPENA